MAALLSTSHISTGALAFRASKRPLRRAVSSRVLAQAQPSSNSIRDSVILSRRSASLLLISSPVAALLAGAAGAQDGITVFEDSVDQFALSLPASWQAGQGAIDGGMMGTRRALAYFPSIEAAADTNMTVVVTNVGADYTSMGSMGTPYAFGQNMVNTMDQSYMLRQWGADPNKPIQIAKLVDARVVGDFYEVEYTVQKAADQPKRHLISLVGLGYNGRYNRLYTLTGQCKEEEWGQYGPVFAQAISSFRPPKFIPRWARTASA